jgi:hypothetical protein
MPRALARIGPTEILAVNWQRRGRRVGSAKPELRGGNKMARCSTSLLTSAIALTLVATAATGVRAQGVVTIQKLSAPLANELVGEAVANCKQKGYRDGGGR